MADPNATDQVLNEIPRGVKMPKGKGWRLVTPGKNGKRHKAALLKTLTVKGERLAIFHLMKKPR